MATEIKTPQAPADDLTDDILGDERLRHAFRRDRTTFFCGRPRTSRLPSPAPKGSPVVETVCSACAAVLASHHDVPVTRLFNDGNYGYYVA